MASSITGNSADFDPATSFALLVPDDGDALNVASIVDDGTTPKTGFWPLADAIQYLRIYSDIYMRGVFGFGNDGALVFDGVATVLGIAPSGGNYTLNRHIFPTNMTVSGGVTVFTSGFGVWGAGTLTLTGTAKLDVSGADASGQTAGAISGSGIWFGGAGGNGGNAASNGSNSTLSNSLGGSGGSGTAGSSGPTPGSVTNTAAGAEKGAIRYPGSFTSGMLYGSTGCTVPTAGSGGSGGGGSGGGAKGGGGGAGGGLMIVMFRTVAFSASCNVWAKGGNGGNGDSGGGFAGGGGGGGGGGVVLIGYMTTTGTTPSTRVSVAGGTGGTGNTTGATGNSGLALIQSLGA